MPTIEITRQDLSISRLRAAAARTADAKRAHRILAIAMVLDGHSRLLAAQAGAMDRGVPCTRKATLRHGRLLKKLRRAGARRNPAGACRPASRNLVSG
ncbi:MAG: hypothetical protein ACREDM_17250 [Methylocella sp.]